MQRVLCFKNLVSTDYSHTVNLTKKAPLNEMPFMFFILEPLVGLDIRNACRRQVLKPLKPRLSFENKLS